MTIAVFTITNKYCLCVKYTIAITKFSIDSAIVHPCLLSFVAVSAFRVK